MLKVYFLSIFVFLVAYCGNDQIAVPPSEKPVDKDKAVVENITSNLVFTGMQNMVGTTERLFVNTRTACSGEGIETATLREDWKRSMQVFHYLEAVPFGAFSANKVGACDYYGGLACRLYSFPMETNTADVQAQMEKAKAEAEAYTFLGDTMNVIGLDTLEYILFEVLKSEDKVTPASDVCPYLQILAADAVLTSAELRKSFSDSQLGSLNSETTEAQYKEALGEIAKSLSFFKQTFLYLKINQLLDLPGSSVARKNKECSDDCSLYMEHPWAMMAKEALQWNLESFGQIYTGDVAGSEKTVEGFGIQDYLKEIGHQKASALPLETSAKIISALNTFESGLDFQNAVDELAGEECLEGALCDLQAQTHALAQWMTNDLLSLLSTDASNGGVGGDAD